MTSLTRQALKEIRNDIDAALAAVATKHGIAFTIGTMRFSSTEFKATLAATVSGSAGGTKSADELAFRNHAVKFGLKPDDFGRKIIVRGRQFIISGLRPTAAQYPFTVTGAGGGRSPACACYHSVRIQSTEGLHAFVS